MLSQFGNAQPGNSNFGSGSAQIANFTAGNILVCVGDPSNHGGNVANSGSNTNVYVNGILVAVQGAIHHCPIIGHGDTAITSTITQRYINGALMLVYGSQAGCGAIIQPPISRGVVLN